MIVNIDIFFNFLTYNSVDEIRRIQLVDKLDSGQRQACIVQVILISPVGGKAGFYVVQQA